MPCIFLKLFKMFGKFMRNRERDDFPVGRNQEHGAVQASDMADSARDVLGRGVQVPGGFVYPHPVNDHMVAGGAAGFTQPRFFEDSVQLIGR